MSRGHHGFPNSRQYHDLECRNLWVKLGSKRYIYLTASFRPEGTPFEDGTFHLQLTFDESYPTRPPACRFLTPIFHPNIYADGSICLDILQNRWSPTYDVTALLTSIQSLLPDPNPTSPANSAAAKLFTERRAAYEVEVRKSVEASWAYKGPNEEESASEQETEQVEDDTEDKESDSKRAKNE